MLWLLPIRLWCKSNKDNINKRAILNAIGAILELIIYIAIIYIVRKLNLF